MHADTCQNHDLFGLQYLLIVCACHICSLSAHAIFFSLRMTYLLVVCECHISSLSVHDIFTHCICMSNFLIVFACHICSLSAHVTFHHCVRMLYLSTVCACHISLLCANLIFVHCLRMPYLITVRECCICPMSAHVTFIKDRPACHDAYYPVQKLQLLDFKQINLTCIEKQVVTNCINRSQFHFLDTIHDCEADAVLYVHRYHNSPLEQKRNNTSAAKGT